MSESRRCGICRETFEAETMNAALQRVRDHRKVAHPGEKAPRGRPPAEPKPATSSPAPDALTLPGLDHEIPPVDPNPELVAPEEPPRRGWRDRLWTGRTNRAETAPVKVDKPRKVRGRRVPTAKAIETIYGGLGFLAYRTGLDRPVGRCLQFQAPAAGEVLEELTRDTFVDVPLQWVASRLDAAEKASALLGLPLLVFLYERASDELRAGVLDPMLRQAIETQLVAMVPVVKKTRKREQEMRDAIAELGLVGDDPVGDVLRMIFTTEEPLPAEAAPTP